MANGKREFRFTFDFVMPVERIMEFARRDVASSDENYRSVSKAVLDVTAEAQSLQKAMADDRDADLGPYFDFWFADAIECANKLLHSEDADARDLAQCLIDMEKATIKSKDSFLAEMNRLGIRPGG